MVPGRKESGQINTIYYTKDDISGQYFLVDTGAEVSVLPAKTWNENGLKGRSLKAANGSRIDTYGHKTLNIGLGSNKYWWKFVIADVDQAIIGSDFLRASGLLVDVKGKRLIDSNSMQTTAKMTVASKINALNLEAFEVAEDVYGKLLAKFPSLTSPTFSAEKVKHGIEHFIRTEGPLPKARARRLEPRKRNLAKQQFDMLMDLGIVYRSESFCSSALVPVEKEDGSIRCCGDFGPLNAITVPDRYPVPHIQDFTSHLHGCKVFSKVDLVRGYHQIPVAVQDRHKTAIITPFGLFEYARMPFGLKNAAQTFQRLMDSVTSGLQFVFVYLDDILIASRTKKEHYGHLQALFERLEQHGLVINPKKCEFGQKQLKFLGHIVTPNGIIPDPAKVKAIKDFNRPQTIKQLQEFLGMINFYHRFVPGIANTLCPFYNALNGNLNSKRKLQWSEEMNQAFAKAKDQLASATLLVHPDPSAAINVTTDASDVAVGAVLQQWTLKVGWEPLAFFSRKLREPEVKYSAYDKELLAIKLALRHFRYHVEGRTFTVYTDHRPLTFAFERKSPPWTKRQQESLAEISSYTTDIQHVSGKNNVVADALSRSLLAAIRQDIDYEQLAIDQEEDAEIQSYKTTFTSLQCENIIIGPNSTRSVLCDTSTGVARPILPAKWRIRAFETVHNLSHPSIRTTVKLMSSKFVWSGLAKDVATWTRQCIPCQKSKTFRHVKTPVQHVKVPSQRFSHVNIDIVGPLPESQGCTYLLSVVDRTTRWPEVFPLKDKEALTCGRAFLQWTTRYGVPTDITSDRGAQFTSKIWSALCELYGAKLHLTTAYHPQSNGIVERFHRHLKSALKASLEDKGHSWTDHLPWVLLGIRTALKEDLKASSAELVFGQPLRVPGDFMPQKLDIEPKEELSRIREATAQLVPIPTTHHGEKISYVPQSLSKADYVFVKEGLLKKVLQPPYVGPFKVLQRRDKSYTLDIGGKEEEISIDRLKEAHLDPTVPIQVELPPKRGRPVATK